MIFQKQNYSQLNKTRVIPTAAAVVRTRRGWKKLIENSVKLELCEMLPNRSSKPVLKMLCFVVYTNLRAHT
jgi:hypothetical protein